MVIAGRAASSGHSSQQAIGITHSRPASQRSLAALGMTEQHAGHATAPSTAPAPHQDIYACAGPALDNDARQRHHLRLLQQDRSSRVWNLGFRIVSRFNASSRRAAERVTDQTSEARKSRPEGEVRSLTGHTSAYHARRRSNARARLCDVADDGQEVGDGDATGDERLLQGLQALAPARDAHDAHACSGHA